MFIIFVFIVYSIQNLPKNSCVIFVLILHQYQKKWVEKNHECNQSTSFSTFYYQDIINLIMLRPHPYGNTVTGLFSTAIKVICKLVGFLNNKQLVTQRNLGSFPSSTCPLKDIPVRCLDLKYISRYFEKRETYGRPIFEDIPKKSGHFLSRISHCGLQILNTFRFIKENVQRT